MLRSSIAQLSGNDGLELSTMWLSGDISSEAGQDADETASTQSKRKLRLAGLFVALIVFGGVLLGLDDSASMDAKEEIERAAQRAGRSIERMKRDAEAENVEGHLSVVDERGYTRSPGVAQGWGGGFTPGAVQPPLKPSVTEQRVSSAGGAPIEGTRTDVGIFSFNPADSDLCEQRTRVLEASRILESFRFSCSGFATSDDPKPCLQECMDALVSMNKTGCVWKVVQHGTTHSMEELSAVQAKATQACFRRRSPASDNDSLSDAPERVGSSEAASEQDGSVDADVRAKHMIIVIVTYWPS